MNLWHNFKNGASRGWQWYAQRSQLQQAGLKFGLASVFLIFMPVGQRMLWPVMLLLMWQGLTVDTRTMRGSSLLALFAIGFLGLVPVAFFLETPLMVIAGFDNPWASGLAVMVEAGLVMAALIGLSLWPDSRLRYTGGISDFLMAGISLGAGMECGISSFFSQPLSHAGMAYWVLPQVPGLLGYNQAPLACASPLVFGLGLGLAVGLARYLLGPDFKAGYWGRDIALGIAGVLLLWLGLERVAYVARVQSGWAGILYTLDLKGRLFAYLLPALALLACWLEWLMLHEQGEVSKKTPLLEIVEQKLKTGKTWQMRFDSLDVVLTARRLEREKKLAGEIRPLLPAAAVAAWQRRLEQVQKELEERGANRET